MRSIPLLALPLWMLTGCWYDNPYIPMVPQQQAIVFTTPAPPPAPDLDAIIGADVDTITPAMFSPLVANMSRKDVDAFFPGVAGTTDPFVKVGSKDPAIDHLRFYFSDDGLRSVEIFFPASTSSTDLYAKLVAHGNKKWGAGTDNGESANWEDAKIGREEGQLRIDVHIDAHRGKAAPLDVAAIVGAGDGTKPPAAFDPFPKTIQREEVSRLGRVLKNGSKTFVTVLTEEGSMYEDIELYYSDDLYPHTVTLKLHPSLSTQEAFLALRAGLEKRYGKSRMSPKDGTDATATRFDWRAPQDLRIERKARLIEIELRYQ